MPLESSVLSFHLFHCCLITLSVCGYWPTNVRELRCCRSFTEHYGVPQYSFWGKCWSRTPLLCRVDAVALLLSKHKIHAELVLQNLHLLLFLLPSRRHVSHSQYPKTERKMDNIYACPKRYACPWKISPWYEHGDIWGEEGLLSLV